LQARRHLKNETQCTPENASRIGFTVTKKTGNAVIRNRIRRRLREVVRLNATSCVQPNHDYVLIAREAALHSPFPALVSDFHKAMGNVSKKMPLNKTGKGH
jgi:ribonuclease P protein component